jgi:hypothetical protein
MEGKIKEEVEWCVRRVFCFEGIMSEGGSGIGLGGSGR